MVQDLINGMSLHSTASDSEWLNVAEESYRESIFKIFSDNDKRKILSATSERSLTIPAILHMCKMPNTAGYRMINSLIREGFIVPVALVLRNGRMVKKYKSIFEDVKIYYDKDKLIVRVKLNRNQVEPAPEVLVSNDGNYLEDDCCTITESLQESPHKA